MGGFRHISDISPEHLSPQSRSWNKRLTAQDHLVCQTPNFRQAPSPLIVCSDQACGARRVRACAMWCGEWCGALHARTRGNGLARGECLPTPSAGSYRETCPPALVKHATKRTSYNWKFCLESVVFLLINSIYTLRSSSRDDNCTWG